MHIGFDAKRFFHNTTGLGNYARSTIRGLLQAFPQHSYVLYTPKDSADFSTLTTSSAVTVQKACPLGQIFPALWRSLAIPSAARADSLDLYHGLSHELPLTPFVPSIKTVVTMHDLLFITHPGLYSVMDRQIYQFKYRTSCQRADLVVAISQKTAEDVATCFKIQPERIRVVYQSCDPVFTTRVGQAEQQRVRATYGLSQDYILFVGSLVARKGCQTLIAALSALAPSKRPALVLVGTGPEEKVLRAQVRALGLEKIVHFLGRVPTQDLPTLYQGAQIFVYPSLGEGFGIPILEALTSQVPVITSTGSCFSEPGGDAALYTRPNDVGELAHALDQVLGDTALGAAMVERGLRQAAKFHPGRTAAQLMAVYTELCPGS